MSAYARSIGHGLAVVPDLPEAETFDPGDEVFLNTADGGMPMIVVSHEDGYVELVSETGQSGVTVHEREVWHR